AKLEVLGRRSNIDLAGLEVVDGPSFRWHGRYHLDMDHRDTLDLQLGVFADFRPKLPAGWEDTPVTFLANIDPDLQLHVLEQARGSRLTACDTIEHWILEKRDRVDQMLSRVDLVFMNEDEARLYAGTPNLHRAASMILDRGCRAALIKKGENGSLVVRRRTDGSTETFVCSAYPLEEVIDPTGAGDAFAGGVMGALAATKDFALDGLRQAVAIGSAMASFAVEGFGPGGLDAVGATDLESRCSAIREMATLPLTQDLPWWQGNEPAK
ncbi:MAG: PfkB family carbohydrate kinase, partial [Candidatus Dormibacteraeota bacterium]|nr:PfkB family carbohydrate kinase [Candidatus Dormibacteraeota bacterium]